MSFLLKIVQGPNAGAEIALAEGVTLSVGSADTCDIVFSDAAVGALAFELEVTHERVMAILPGGKTLKLDPYHVTRVGTTALAVGPLEETWKELIWPTSESLPAEDDPTEAVDTAEPEPEPEPVSPRRTFGCFWMLPILIALLVIGIWLIRKYPDQSGWTWLREKTTTCTQGLKTHKSAQKPAETLAEAAEACGFTLSEKSGRTIAFGNFVTRADRLQATARVYAAQPGVQVDFADAESLKAAVDELLSLVSDGDVQALKIEGRKLFLSGTVSSQVELRKILESLSTDVPKITETDCSEVTVVGISSVAHGQDDEESRYQLPRLPAMRHTPRATTAASGTLPIVGILTVPYPCLVLENGTRAMEGARFGAYTIEKIEADSVTVSGDDGIFVWRP